MNFTETLPDENYPAIRLISESGVWEMGVVPVLLGLRVCAGLVGSGGYSLNYCCGNDRGMTIGVMACVMAALEQFDEQVASWEVERTFPAQMRRPMLNDVECWEKLSELANWDREPTPHSNR